jgi:hypothetical protein
MLRKAFRRPLICVVLLLLGCLLSLHFWKWYGPTPYRTLRLFIKALQRKDAEAIWQLCGGDASRSLPKGVEWNAIILPPKENFKQFLEQFVFNRLPDNAQLYWEHNPIMTRRFLWFHRHSSTLFYFSLKGPEGFWMPVLIQKVFGKWRIKPRTTFGGYLRVLIEKTEKLPTEQANQKAGQIWAKYGGAWKYGEPIGAISE